MEVGEALRNLADLVDAIDEMGATVTEATPQTVTDDGRCIAQVTVEIPAEAAIGTATATESARRAGIEPDGSIGTPRLATSPHRDPDPTGPGHAKLDHRSGPTPVASAATEDSTETGPTAAEPSDSADSNAVDAASVSPDAVSADSDLVDGDTPVDGSSEAEATPGESDPVDGDSTADDSNDAGVDDDAEVPCTHPGCEDVFDSDNGMRIHRSKAHDGSGPVGDPERLRTVYEREDSFEAMREALDVDVSAQTVRRWMLSAGLHSVGDDDLDSQGDARNDDEAGEPESGDHTTGTEQDPETDGVDEEPAEAPASQRDLLPEVDAALPDGVTATELRAAVENASTLYDVQQRLEMDRETAREVLSAYDLLELVHGRVADRHRREELKAEIDDRLRSNATPADSPSD